MKLIYTLLTFFFLSMGIGNSQIVISEIMYNPPESGQDSLEYIELFNTTGNDIDISGYYFSEGIKHTFADNTILKAEGFIVVAVSDDAVENVFGVDVEEWESGGLSNGGETISLNDADSSLVTSVEYSDGGDWPSAADGDGPSLVMCNLYGPQADPGNWNVATESTGVEINGHEVLGSPTRANSSSCLGNVDNLVTVTNFKFEPADITIGIGESVTWNVIEGRHNINGSQSTFPDNPESFTSGVSAPAPWTYTYTFTVPGVYSYQSDDHASSMQGTVTVLGNPYPFYLIQEVTTEDSDGVADSVGVQCSLTGFVGSPNYRPGGLTFIIQDGPNSGITVFANEDFGYTPTIGDEVFIKGSISQYNGLTEINVDSIFLISQGNDIFGPEVVTELNDDNESTLVTIEDVKIVDASQWQQAGSFNVDISNGVDTFAMRIDGDMGFEGAKAPDGTFDVTGTVSQFDPSSPYFEGYQLLPRSKDDIDPYVIAGPSYPQYEIADVIENDDSGLPDSIGVTCSLKGIVIRGNLDSDGYQFVITNPDNTAGITVFRYAAINGYIPQSGDIVEVKGEIDFYKGLTQISIDSIELLSSGNPLPDPIEVKELGEETENLYITMTYAELVNQDIWPGDSSSHNIDILSEAGNEYTMRIDSDVPLARTPIDPAERDWSAISITGVGGQYDGSSPHFEGYQIFPFTESDISAVTSFTFVPEDVEIHVFPNPVQATLTIKADINMEHISIYSVDGTLVESTELNTNNARMNIADLVPGTYQLLIETPEGIAVKKIVKE